MVSQALDKFHDDLASLNSAIQDYVKRRRLQQEKGVEIISQARQGVCRIQSCLREVRSFVDDFCFQRQGCCEIFTVAQWNLAGVNTNPLAFQTHRDSNPETVLAIKFSHEIDLLLEKVSRQEKDCVFSQRVESMTCSDLLGSCVALSVSGKPSLKDALCNRESEKIGVIWHQNLKGKTFSTADMVFKKRTWSLCSLKPGMVRKFIEALVADDRSVWWSQWHESLMDCGVDDQKFKKNAIEVAVFDGILFEAARVVLSTSQYQTHELVESLEKFVEGMGVDPNAKGQQLAKSFTWIQNLQPVVQAICIQEFSKDWIKAGPLAQFWPSLLQNFEMFEPSEIKNPQQVTILLVRKDGLFRVDRKHTETAQKCLQDGEFLGDHEEEVLDLFNGIYGEDNAGSKLMEMVMDMRIKVAVAVGWRGEHLTLLVAAHASSDGTNNRALVGVMHVLAKELGATLVLGLDANSNASFDGDAKAAGAADCKTFESFLRSRGLHHCFEDLDVPCEHSVQKERTFLQAQLKKARVIDRSLKDWIVGTAAERLRGFRVNMASGDVLAEAATWDPDLYMPFPGFPSDHALILAAIQYKD